MRVVAFCIKDVKSLNFVFLFIDMEQGELFNFDQPITLDEVFEAFFMSVDCLALYEKLKAFVHRYYVGADKNLLLWLIQLVVLNRPQQNCIRKGKKLNWVDLPPHKSLFYAQKFNGMPIGNLTSQIFANFYLNEFDSFIESFKTVDYIRYVDDFIVIHPSRNGLKRLMKKAREFLKKRLKLVLHPKKVYL